MTRRFACALAIVCLGLCSRSHAQQNPVGAAAPAAAAAASDPNGVEFALGRYVVTFNKHDADALAALWTPTGLYVDKGTGRRSEGHDALLADFRELFAASPAVALSGEVESVRSLGDDIAMVDGTSITVTPGSAPESSSYSAIFKRVGGKWLIDSVHEMPLPTPESPRQALQPLAWLVGHWQDQVEGTRVDTVTRWSPGEAFIVRSYAVEREGEPAFHGTQVIGWDPRASQIRSWTFHSDGSFGEGMWSKSQDEWLVRTTQTLPDGRAATGTQVIKQIDVNSASVQMVGKEVDGLLEPASPAVKMVRIEVQDPMAPAAATSTPSSGAAVSQSGAPASGEAGR